MGNALALGGLIVLVVFALQGLAVVVFGVSLFAIVRRWLRRRRRTDPGDRPHPPEDPRLAGG
jgi:membrane protein implicated in regulation of membrane protease activity